MTEDLFALGWQHHRSGDFRKAEEVYRTLLRREPRNGRTWFVLGNLCADQGRLGEAAACIRQAVELEPREPMGFLHLGNALLRQDRIAEAEEAYRKCLELPTGREGPATRVDALVNLGFLLGDQEKLDEARECYEKARSLNPAVAEIHHNLGNILREQGKRDEAIACYDEALRLRPTYAKAYVNKGIALVAGGNVESAHECLRRAVELDPKVAEAHNSLGTILSARGQPEDAVAQYEIALGLKPDYPEAHWNRALVQLLQGDYERGWPDYEWRWKCKRAFQIPRFAQPRWDGGPLAGKTILLYAEQGLGDTLHFIRYVPLVQARGGRVIVQCQAALIPLLSRCAGIDELVPWGSPSPAFDVYAALLSLPALFHTTVETIPADIPYLHADPTLVEHWRRQLGVLDGFKVGIAWQGSTRHAWDGHRSVSLEAFAPLARVPGVRLISLQKGTGVEQVQSVAGSFSLADFGDLVDRTAGAFMDTAAILQSLDLVICVDTAVAHLAGGQGVPVWLALHHTPDWRWLRVRRDSPWYPSARLFRQPSPGAWGPVFAQIAQELAEIARRRAPRRLMVEVSAGELLDKLSILDIKSRRIADSGKLRNIEVERKALAAVRATLPASAELSTLEEQLLKVNEQLWDIEDAIRACEREGDFGPRFVELARSVYHCNDRRSGLKRAINELLGSSIVEEKSYTEYGPVPTAETS
jgi:tetratricopeptide (TPR) repeat protein